jgi:RimJ/RimL family protein N-acetyltransferase
LLLDDPAWQGARMPPTTVLTAPTLTDGVVTLRAHRADDARGSYEQCQDPLSQRWTTVPVPYTSEMATSFVTELMPAGWIEDREWGFAVEHDGRYAGTMSLRPEGDGRAEIAYGSHPRVRGAGVTERALRLLLAWGFEERELRSVIWWAHRGNWASRKLAWRLGFSCDGTLRQWLPQRGELRDAWVGTLQRGEPREPRTTWLDCPVLGAGGVRLRPWRADDADRIVEACRDERTAHWLGRLPRPYTRADAETYLHDREEVLASGSAVGWAVADAGSDELVGSLAVFDLDGHQGEVGYWTHPDARGRGCMTAAVGLAVGHAREGLGLRRLTAVAAVDNTASRHVIEANGFALVGIERASTRIRTGFTDTAAYDLLL